MTRTNSHRSRTFLGLGLLFVCALVLNLSGTWSLPLVDRDETYYAEVSREMLERADWVVPTFNLRPFYEKPPLTYWCQMAAFRIFGENEFAARFPSALAAALTALAVSGLCRRLRGAGSDPGAAWRAAIVFLLSLHVFVVAHGGVTDMPMVLFSTLAVRAGWELLGCGDDATEGVARQRRSFWWWTFYLMLALIFLAKGPLLVLPPATVLVFAAATRRRDVWRRMKFGRGLLVTAFVAGLWAVPVWIRTNGEIFAVGMGVHVVGRTFASMQGHGARGVASYFALLPFYFVTLFLSFLPWSPVLPRLVAALRRERTPGELYLVCNVLLIFGLFSLATTKLPHYTLPAFPMLACLAVPYLRGKRFARTALVTGCVYLVVTLVGFPCATRWFPARQLAKGCAPLLTPEMKLAAFGFEEPSLVWEFRKHLRAPLEKIGPDELNAWMDLPGPRLCVMPAGQMPAMPWRCIRVTGFDTAKGRRVDLVAEVKTGD
jgi:4-amino-4-deoxy-L-arabinose transferase-like glycosyltransferase